MATGYIDSNGNRHIISGMVTGERPKYEMAEYLALTDKPTDWICTDYDATSEYGINATEVKYDNNNSVKDMLDLKGGTFTASTGVTIGSRNNWYKQGRFAFISLVLTISSNISSGNTLVSTTGLNLANSVYIYARKDSDGTIINLTSDGNNIITESALASGTILRIGATVPTAS